MLLPSLHSLLGLSLLFSLLEALQVPLGPPHEPSVPFLSLENENYDAWDIHVAPNENSTGHLVFETVNSLMQHWPNTRYRHGHNIVPGIVPSGTVLYHGRGDANTPIGPEWTATDPEQSYFFCHEHADCWQLILTVIRPLNVIYFDGSGAAKMPDGSMDSQDVLAFRDILPEKYSSEKERVDNMCEWGNHFNVDGFVRTEVDFEIILCDFTKGVQIEAINLRNVQGRGLDSRRPGVPGGLFSPDLKLDIDPGVAFEVMHSGSWHRYYPGETRIQLDLTRLVSFYDIELAPSLLAQRIGKPRLEHRLLGISQTDLQSAFRRIETATFVSEPGSGIDWQTLIRLIVKRFEDRLEIVQYILNSTNTGNSASENEKRAKNVQVQLVAMLRPYMLSTVKPSTEFTSTEWVSPVYKLCSTTYTKYITTTPSLLSTLTASENLILGSVLETTREICRVVTGMWVDGVMAGLDPDLHKPSTITDTAIESLLESWKARISSLMKWLDWNVWLKCRPACGFEEMCELPMWPLFEPSDNVNDPKPKCVRRMAPYTGIGMFE